MLAGLLPLADAQMELPEAKAAVSDKRPHAELSSQGQGLAIARVCHLTLGRLAVCGGVAEESEGPGPHPRLSFARATSPEFSPTLMCTGTPTVRCTSSA